MSRPDRARTVVRLQLRQRAPGKGLKLTARDGEFELSPERCSLSAIRQAAIIHRSSVEKPTPSRSKDARNSTDDDDIFI